MSITHVALVRDNSVSMRSYQKDALEDFNNVLEGIKKEETLVNKIYGSVVEFCSGYGSSGRTTL